MTPSDTPFEAAMLSDAMLRAQRLIDELKKQQNEIAASPPNPPPEQLAEGREALQAAIQSAERMLAGLHEAAALRAENTLA